MARLFWRRRETFGSILMILILLEFNHSVFVALTERSGAIQARIVVLIAVFGHRSKIDASGLRFHDSSDHAGIQRAVAVA